MLSPRWRCPGGQSDPDNPVTVQFVIEGSTYTISNVYYPDGDSQLVWVKWHTPDETLCLHHSGQGTGRRHGAKAPSPPTLWIWTATTRPIPWPMTETTPSPSWISQRKKKCPPPPGGIWSPWWQENWVWVENWEKCWHTDRWTDSEGKSHTDRWYHWVDNGWWEDQGLVGI